MSVHFWILPIALAVLLAAILGQERKAWLELSPAEKKKRIAPIIVEMALLVVGSFFLESF